MQRLSRFLLGTLRGRLILSVALVHAVMMSLFIVDLVGRQDEMLLDRQVEEATALSQALATSAADWIQADDIAGLQELVDAQRSNEDVLFVVFTDQAGRALASTDAARQGQFVLDLPRVVELSILSRAETLVDVAAPAMAGTSHVGWARVGIGEKTTGEQRAEILRNGVLYALGAILIGSTIAWFMGRRISRRLYAVQETIDAVRSGDHGARSAITGTDEAATMAREFNSMLDALGERDAEVRIGVERYRSLIEKVQAAIVVHDGEGRVMESNPLARELLGLTQAELHGRALIDPGWHFVNEDGSVMPAADYPAGRVLATRQPLRDYVVGIRRPGRDDVTWALVNAEPEHDDAGAVNRIVVSFVDITERKRADEALRQLNRELEAVSSCNQVLVRAQDEQALLDDICRIICDEAGYRLAWVGFAEQDDEKTVLPAARAGVEDGYLDVAGISWADTERGSGPTGTAIRTGETICIQDLATDPRASAWRDSARQRGYRSSIALPLKDEDGSTFGALSIHSAEPGAFTPEEIRLLEELAGDLAFGITVLRTRDERRHAAEELYRSEAQLREAQRVTHIGSWRYDARTASSEWSEESYRIFGVESGRPINDESFLEAIHPDDREAFVRVWTAALRGEPYDFEHRILVDGRTRWVREQAEFTFDPAGAPIQAIGTTQDITEHRRAEAALRESEAKFRGLFENTPVAIWEEDFSEVWARLERLPRGEIGDIDAYLRAHPEVARECTDLVRVIDVNDAAVRLHQAASKDELLAGLARVFTPESFEAFRAELVAMWNGGTRVLADAVVRTLAGELRHVTISWAVVPGHEQSFERVIVAEVDVTERKAAEEASRKTEERLRLEVARMPIGYVIWDKDFRVVSWNPAAEAIFGFSFDEAEGRHPYDLIVPPEAQPQVDDIWRRLLAGDASAHSVNENRRKDGRTIICDWTNTPLKQPDGTILGVMSMVQDITERRHAEQALREQHSTLRGIIEGVPALVFSVDGQYRYTSFNEGHAAAMRAIYGVEIEQGHSVLDYMTVAEDRETARHNLDQALAGEQLVEEAYSGETQLARRYFRVSHSPIRSGDEVIGVAVLAQDLTERKRLEDQLRQAQKMEAIGRLAGGVAHDFNNLLTAINGYADILIAGMAPDEPRRADAEEIRKAGDRAAALTRQLLAFSRRQVLKPVVLDLNDVVAGITPMLRRLVGEQIEVRALGDPDLGRVRADASQIEQVLLNLAVNARDAMPGGGTLTMETANVELGDEDEETYPLVAPGPYVMLAVSDTGIGMDAATMAHLFEPFFTTKPAGEGTGLGLATVYGIVTGSGGRVAAYSEPGKGSIFKVYLPRVSAAVEPQAAEARPAEGGAEAILVVEDEDAVRAYVERVLATLGYTVSAARSGTDALALLAAHPGPIDLLVTDIMLPGMNGRELAERLSARQPSLRTLYISGYTEDSVIHQGVLDPGVAFLAKPFTPDALGRAVRDALDAPGTASV